MERAHARRWFVMGCGYAVTAGLGWLGGVKMTEPQGWLVTTVIWVVLIFGLAGLCLGAFWNWYKVFGPRLPKGLRLHETTPIKGDSGLPQRYLRLTATESLRASGFRVVCDRSFYDCSFYMYQGGVGEPLKSDSSRKTEDGVVLFRLPVPEIKSGSMLFFTFEGFEPLAVQSVKIIPAWDS